MYTDDRSRLKHMLDAAKQACEFIHGKDQNELYTDLMFQYALIRVIEIIGEAGKQVSDDFKSSHPEIPWIEIANMRNRLIHGYFKINLNVVWDTATSDLPLLIKQLEKILE